jgi:predicted RNase H-related nuclease YkuK (DUF458 family)
MCNKGFAAPGHWKTKSLSSMCVLNADLLGAQIKKAPAGWAGATRQNDLQGDNNAAETALALQHKRVSFAMHHAGIHQNFMEKDTDLHHLSSHGLLPVVNTHMHPLRQLDLPAVARFIAAQSASTRIYIGADSCRLLEGQVWHADYTLVIVVHIDGNRGCKLFGETTRERDFDQRADRPHLRLMNEVYKVADLYLRLSDAIGQRPVEVHLDINPDPAAGSSCVIQQAVGYIRGVCNLSPRVKPHAFAASCAADRYKEIASSHPSGLRAA